ncbi:MAG TPA: polysaccharide biosynthesis/export family protein [Candidatus Angelobacter sp.]|nr:polysaccharide biosynthesis/export family protein [Candidatus Angelobacter sp.]
MIRRLLHRVGRAWTAIGAVVLLAALGMAQSPSALEAGGEHASTGAPAMRLDAGDLLEITTFDTPELSGKFRVDSRGYVTLPLGGAGPVQGLTAEQAGTAMERLLRDHDILKHPHVTVLVLEYATQGVNVLGEVKQPGIYPLEGKHGVLDLLSMAGGLMPTASKVVSITHQAPPWDTVTVNLAGTQGNSLENDVAVQPGDRVVALRAGVVYVIGDVGKPGGYVVDGNGVTVVQALALAQGMNRTAKSNGMLIRNAPSGRVEMQLALNKILTNKAPDPALQDGDIVYVPVSGAKDWTNKGVTAALQMAVGMVIYGHY